MSYYKYIIRGEAELLHFIQEFQLTNDLFCCIDKVTSIHPTPTPRKKKNKRHSEVLLRRRT